MRIDLEQMPFSRNGTHFAVSWLGPERGVPEGLYLRTVHGDARDRELYRLELVRGGEPVPTTVDASPARLRLEADGGWAELCIPDPGTVRVRAQGVDLRLTGLPRSPYDLLVQQTEDRWKHIAYGANRNLLLTRLSGDLLVEHSWTGIKDDALAITGRGSGGPFELVVEEALGARRPGRERPSFDACVSGAERDFAAWLALAPPVGPQHAAARELAAYLTWSSVVAPGGLVRRPSMLMSKNWMTSVWSWDHCFNAMALTGDVPLACDQVMTMFDHQDASGVLPDSFHDAGATYNFAKPPVHGWTISWLMRRADLPEEFLREVYGPLAAWTEWWFRERDHDGDGLPQYDHGNDSGWDNGTVFRQSVPVESPDLGAFLVLQMDALADLAQRLGRPGEQSDWRDRSDRLLAAVLDAFWTGERLTARHAITHEPVDSRSLLLHVPLVLGDRLPGDVFEALADGLAQSGLLTEHGLATEPPDSPFYEADGYWRGPIWAPPTLLVVDGLTRGGRPELARQVAQRFCDTVAAHGMAENFDAVTGQGLRDLGYTWTASAFLVLASSYL